MVDKSKRVLIVEDDDLIVQMYQASLSHAPFSLTIVKDGEAGWKTIQETSPDLVILDFMLPKLNGVEILAKMRADSQFKSTPAVILSSLMDDADKQRAFDAGATAYWVKNEVNMVEFAQNITNLLTGHNPRRKL